MNLSNLFKKQKETVASEPQIEQTTIIGIPGVWKDKADLLVSVEEECGNEYSLNGTVLTHKESGLNYELDIYDFDPAMWLGFKEWSRTRLSEEYLDLLDTHTHTIYLVGPGGSIDRAQRMVDLATKMIEAGGLGVKIETTGTAFDLESWNGIIDVPSPISLYSIFVRQSHNPRMNFSYTCGMHNLGLRDVTSRGVDLNKALPAVTQFNTERILQSLSVSDGMIYSVDGTSFLVSIETTCPNSEDEYYGNPWGMWLLTNAN